VFLAITKQMEHCLWGQLTHYWVKMEKPDTPFYSNVIRQNRYWHILQLLHFAENRNGVDRTISKFYSPSGNLAINEMTVLFKGTVIFRKYIPKKHNHFGIQINNLCHSTGYTYNMTVYLRMVQHLTETHATVTELTRIIEGHGHKLYMDNFFSSPHIFNDSAKKM
jgi:hypothetical protein